MTAGAGVGGIQDWFVEKGVGHGQFFIAGLSFSIALFENLLETSLQKQLQNKPRLTSTPVNSSKL
jgi:hypothetical protein